MTYVVELLGLLIAALGLASAASPRLAHSLGRFWEREDALRIAVALRLATGLVLVWAAPACRLPTLVFVLGVLSLVAASIVPVLGRRRIDRLVAMFLDGPPAWVRIWGLATAALGGALVYAAS